MITLTETLRRRPLRPAVVERLSVLVVEDDPTECVPVVAGLLGFSA